MLSLKEKVICLAVALTPIKGEYKADVYSRSPVDYYLIKAIKLENYTRGTKEIIHLKKDKSEIQVPC